jgi:hypothetical protein
MSKPIVEDPQELQSVADVLVTAIVHDVNSSNLLAVHLVAVHGVVTTLHQAELGVNSVESSTVVGSVASLVTKDLVHFFQSETLGLGDHEEDEAGREETHDTEEDECAVVHRADHIRGSLSDGEVVEPVGRGTDGDTLGSDTEREDFGNENPCTGSPRVSKVDLVDPDECYGNPTSSFACATLPFGRSVVTI